MADPQGGAPDQGGVLPDVLEPGLKAVFCGSAASDTSAKLGKYYAGPGNKFWPILHKVGLTPHELRPCDFKMLPEYGLGLTDLNKIESGVDKSLNPDAYDVPGLINKIKRYKPRILALHGKKTAQTVSKYCWKIGEVGYGSLQRKIGTSEVWVLTQTSGANARNWSEDPWKELAAYIKQMPA